MSGRKSHWTEQGALNLLRIMAGFLIWQHGIQKLFGILGRDAPVEFFSLLGLAGILETVGGILLVLGLFTRPVALLLSGEMAWAYFQSHAPNGFWPIMNRGERAALFSFVFLYLAARGGGGFSVDGILKLRKRGKEIPRTEGQPETASSSGDDVPELTEEDLAADPELAELLKDHTKE